MSAKRLYKRILDAKDGETGSCTVRELEMLVDACLEDQAYAIQFWNDMQTYGLREALTYLRNSGLAKEVPEYAYKLLDEMGFGRKTPRNPNVTKIIPAEKRPDRRIGPPDRRS